MKKYRNDSGKNVGFLIDGKTYDFQNGQIVLVPDNFKENVQDILSKINLADKESITVESTVTVADTVPKPVEIKPKKKSGKK